MRPATTSLSRRRDRQKPPGASSRSTARTRLSWTDRGRPGRAPGESSGTRAMPLRMARSRSPARRERLDPDATPMRTIRRRRPVHLGAAGADQSGHPDDLPARMVNETFSNAPARVRSRTSRTVAPGSAAPAVRQRGDVASDILRISSSRVTAPTAPESTTRPSRRTVTGRPSAKISSRRWLTYSSRDATAPKVADDAKGAPSPTRRGMPWAHRG